MTSASGQDQVVAFTKSIAGVPDVTEFKDSCTCSQGPVDASTALDDAAARRLLTSFDPQEIKTVADFGHFSDAMKRDRET